ncbi:MAG TPA: Gfo/Idh/MocA family oxidoreductase [Paracoccus sp. (in: a-proteobacteria)]|uniref:Gfo/Idh/MocA family protein n=1 Tax=uncultured Paracoccus sp. TaxID=189685 RepID=UPI0026333273|nr:Gfo/Idh/MocA family oxidoreductase [uncultured Paracoccus sp.]HMQ41915.1 Gfo/Idh/MocA family oxidoreductase [Paracoccus sp. (in: a-proteobacteria)]HMR37218.1 Gfo/Idh/MocA family oxidoreductase [Paracoccus sp. (in: a-proteobacteria)]
MSARLKLGMVGGGQGAFIGGVHRIAARIDGQWDLVAGALSSNPDRARASAADLGIAPDRAYADFAEMARVEAAREDGIDAVAIVTPNHMHAAPAIAFLNAGIHVICDKPLAASLEDAEAIAKAAANSSARFILTHNYTAYPLIRQAREMVAAGELGEIRLVQVEYAQDWLAEDTSNKQADWRTDPARSGAGGAVGDIGTHAFNLAGFVTGLRAEELAAELTAFVPGRRVDDNVNVMLRYPGGARGMLWASQVAIGNENALRLRVYGSTGGLDWEQETPNIMRFTRFGQPTQLLTRGGAGATLEGQANLRTPAGHPEGYLEGFATLYAEAARMIREGAPAGANLPGIADGLAGMRFIAASIASSRENGVWKPL